jgi:CHASE2 domain-containing sensor protein/class 3 adenylate cyclase
MSQREQSSRIAVLLYTDMVDSVGLQRRLGTETYSRLLKLHHQLLFRAVEDEFDGKIRNDTGDGVLCELDTPAAAVNAALLFQMLLRETRWEKEAPQVRIGIHQGQLAEFQLDTVSTGRLVGMPVNIAARIMSIAQAGQILMTRPVYDDARHFVREHPISSTAKGRRPELEWKSHGQYLLKGGDDTVELFEVGASGFAPLTPPSSSEKAWTAPPPVSPLVVRRVARSPWIGAAISVLCGLVLWGTTLGDGLVNASFDNLVRFGSRTVTNQVVIVFMDNEAFQALGQTRDKPWDRALHARLLDKLADDGCPLVALDVRLLRERETESDKALTSALSRLSNVVLAAEQASVSHSGLEAARPAQPLDLFLNAARTNWGVAWFDADLDLVVRRDWPFPNPDWFPTLPWTMAKLAGAKLSNEPQKRWIRYYDLDKTWTALSYHLALAKSPGFFRDKVVFIGNKPRTSLPDNEEDEFRSPQFGWTGETVSGVELLATTFLNLVNNHSLKRTAWPIEGIIFLVAGALLGASLCRLPVWWGVGGALGTALLITVAGVTLSYFTNYWFPWLILVGAQLPCAMVWALIPGKLHFQPATEPPAARGELQVAKKSAAANVADETLPDASDYELIEPPIGKGGFGKVWIVRNAIGQWQALKAVYASSFGDNRGPYEAEFKGLERYKPVSEKHPGLLRIDFISKMKEQGYFYYVMELGDAQFPGWERQPHLYKPRDLEVVRKQAYERRLPQAECVRIVTILAEALAFLHEQGLTHRDIKPSNVIFVNGRPKLADIGLVANIRPANEVRTAVGTPGYMPPPPEKSGTSQADIYALGMVLYVISTGREPEFFPDIATKLMDNSGYGNFVRLNAIILKACHPDPQLRYTAAAVMLRDLQELLNTMS